MTAPEDFDFDEAEERREGRADRAVVRFCLGLCVVAAIVAAVLIVRGCAA